MESRKLATLERAEKIIGLRDRVSPLYGFRNFADLLELKDITGFLHTLSTHLSAATKGDWAGPFTIPGSMDRPVHAALLRIDNVMLLKSEY